MGRFRIYLDGTLMQDEPIGLPEASLKLVRDEKLKGIFFKYTADITFYGDGYNYLKSVADSNDDCAQVTCTIEYQCFNDQPYQTLYEGIVAIGGDEVEWDDQYCIVSAKIEAADFSDFLQRYGDYKVKVNDAFCIDRTSSLTPINENITDFFPGFLGGHTFTNRKTYLFTDVLQQVLSFLSNDNITTDMDALYSTLFVPQELELDFIAPLLPGDVVDFSFVNYYEQEYSTSKIISATPTLSVEFLMDEMLHQSDPTITPAYTARDNYFEKASQTTKSSAPSSGGIKNHLPWRSWSLSVNGGAKPSQVNIIAPFAYGLKNLAITSTTLLQQQDSPMYVTLNQLLRHMAQFHNMSYQLQAAGAGYTFKVRKLETTMDDTSTSVVLNNVPNIKYKASGAFSLSTLETPQGKADNVFKPLSWNTGFCFGDSVSVEGELYSSQELFDVLNATTDQKQDDKLVFVFLKDGDLTLAERYVFRIGQNGTSFTDYFHYNVPYLGPFIASRYNINAGIKEYVTNIDISAFESLDYSCTGCPTATLDNTITKNLRRLYTFDYPLTFAQVQDLINGSLNYVQFDDGKGNNRSGFIKEVEIPFSNFVATFELYAE